MWFFILYDSVLPWCGHTHHLCQLHTLRSVLICVVDIVLGPTGRTQHLAVFRVEDDHTEKRAGVAKGKTGTSS